MSEEMIKQIKKLLIDNTEVYDDEPIFQGLELLIKDNYISKDKIREKIKELKECRMRAISDIGLQIFNAEISMLEQLLED